VILKVIGSFIAGSLLGIWFVWQDARDQHLVNMYDCAHAADKAQVSLEEAYIQCERAAR
jgi:hypothetical protein